MTNYQKEFERIVAALPAGKARPRLLLHSCCAPCSSAVLEVLCQSFDVTIDFYNPNIAPRSEYDHRLAELRRLAAEMPLPSPVAFCADVPYEPQRFAEISRGLENCPEGGERCFACYRLRLADAAHRAADGGFDWFTTTLTISPLKNAAKLNEIGAALGAAVGVPFLPSDFKKKDGYKRSIALSREYGLYRQDYCGCAFSKKAREEQKARAADAAQDVGAR